AHPASVDSCVRRRFDQGVQRHHYDAGAGPPQAVTTGSPVQPLWSPSASQVESANLTRFMRESGAADFPALYRWSIEKPEEFWPAVWRFAGVVTTERPGRDPWDKVFVGDGRVAPPTAQGPRWFEGARLNFAENLLRHSDDRTAVVAWNENG